MDTSPNQISEVEFEQLLAAASQTGRTLQVLTGGRELATPALPDVREDDDLLSAPQE